MDNGIKVTTRVLFKIKRRNSEKKKKLHEFLKRIWSFKSVLLKNRLKTSLSQLIKQRRITYTFGMSFPVIIYLKCRVFSNLLKNTTHHIWFSIHFHVILMNLRATRYCSYRHFIYSIGVTCPCHLLIYT